MKITTHQNVATTTAPTSSTAAAIEQNLTTPVNRLFEDNDEQTGSVEEELSNRIFQEGNGQKLVKFCRELAAILIRNYSVNAEVGEFRDKLCASLMATLKCEEKQAESLIELALELIHAKSHGTYRRTSVDLTYLIATATGAVNDVSSN